MTKVINLKDLRLEGAAKWVHRFVMFVTYPFRHFFAFLMLILLLLVAGVALAMFYGVPFNEIPAWYGQKIGIFEPLKKPEIKAAPKKIKTLKFSKEVKLKHAVFEPKKAEDTKNKEPEKTVEPEKYATWKIKNKAVSSQQEIKAKDTIVKTEEKVIEKEQKEAMPPASAESEILVKEAVVPEEKPASKLKYIKRDDLDLIYYEVPRRVSGEAIIYNANEISVDDTYLYLYGIYTDPNVYNEAQARSYLREMIAKKTVNCYIVARTKDGTGTAICFADDKNINEGLVRAYLADNVAL